MHRRSLPLLALAAAVALVPATAGAATTSPAPRTGAWRGTTTTKDGGVHKVSFRVVRRHGRYVLSSFSASYTVGCQALDAGSSPSGEPRPASRGTEKFTDTDVRVRTNARFRGGADAVYAGRFSSSRRATGTITAFDDDARACSFAGATFEAKPVASS